MSAQFRPAFISGAAQFRAAWLASSLPALVQPASTTNAGAWTSTEASLHAAVSEAVVDDANYISVESGSSCTMELAEAATPTANVVLSYRAVSLYGSDLTLRLFQGATEIMTRTHPLTSTLTLYTCSLTAPEVALITAGPISVTLTAS